MQKSFASAKFKKKKKEKSAVDEADFLSDFSCSFMSVLTLIQGLYTIHYSVFYNIELGSSLISGHLTILDGYYFP